MRNALFVRKPVVQVALIILLSAMVAVVFTRVQDRAWATSGTVTYNTLRDSGVVAETRSTLRTSGTVSETYNTLRVYGDGDWPKQPGEPPGNMGAGSGMVSDEITGLLAEDQPYTDTIAIFNPQLPQAPRKDSITWNPLFMSRETPDENRDLYDRILANGDASEKVWFRMWYEPEHWDKDLNANGEFDRDTGEPTDDDLWYPAIMQEFTYLLMEPQPLEEKPEPTYGQAGQTSLVFPVGMRKEDLFAHDWEVDTSSDNAQYGYGLTSLDANFDGKPDIVHVESEETLQILTDIGADFDGDNEIEDLGDDTQLNGDELVVFRVEFPDPVPIGECVQFLDHLVCLRAVFNDRVNIQWRYTGDLTPTGARGASIPIGGMLLAGEGTETVVLSKGEDNIGEVPPGAFFVWVQNADPDEGTARLHVGRALGATHSAMEALGGGVDLSKGDPWFLKRFYVDGHEYNVVAIKAVASEFKFITIRTPIPKVPVERIHQHSVTLQDYPEEEPLSVMPPYNFEHYILKDVQAITAFDTDEDYVDYLGDLVGPVPPILQKNVLLPYVGAYPDHSVGPYDDPREVYLRYVREDANPQFLGELKEKYGEIEAPEPEIQAAIDAGIAWLVAQQNPDGSWGTSYQVGKTAFAVKKLEHHCVDPYYGLGLPSPFDPACPYSDTIQNGLNYIFANAHILGIGMQPAGDPDTDVDGIGVYFGPGPLWTYETGIALMAIAETTTPDRVVDVPGSPVDGWTYEEVAQDTVDYLAWGQADINTGTSQGGWGYAGCDSGVWTGPPGSDNSNTGYAVLGLQFAQAPPPEGFGLTIPQFVKDELCIWIGYIQCDPGDPGYTAGDDGGSGYTNPCEWVNIYKTGHLLKEMEFAGGACGRQQAAIDYLVRHWNDANDDPGWKGQADPLTPPFLTLASYQAMYTAMEGLVAKGHVNPAVIDGIYWQIDFDNVLVAQQDVNGSWPPCVWDDGERILSTEWALLTLQKVAPVPVSPPVTEFWYVEQWWTRPWEYTEFVLPDIGEDITGVDNPDLYLLTSAFTAFQSEYLYWIQDETFPDFPLRYNLAREDSEWKHMVTNTITSTLPGWKPRVKFWFDPAVGGKKYKGATGLRLYGRDNEGAGDITATDPIKPAYPVEVAPYTDPWAPFNPQLPQAPRKDSLTFNPAYMSDSHHGPELLAQLYTNISIEGHNAWEKVFLRMWYEPEYVHKIQDTDVYTFPALMQEFTYMFVDTRGRPSHSQPGKGSLAFPIGTTADELPAPVGGSIPSDKLPSFGYGLTTFDADFNGEYDIVTIHSERTISETRNIGVDFDCDGKIDPLEGDGDELSGDELVVFVVEHLPLKLGESAMFLDHMVTLDNVVCPHGQPCSADLKLWYTGGGQHDADSLHPDEGDVTSLDVKQMAVVNKGRAVEIKPGGNNLGCEPRPLDGAWFVYLEAVNTLEEAELTIGRALGAAHSAIDNLNGQHDTEKGDPWYLKRFFVDGHEYNVVAIKTVPADTTPGEKYEFKYITIRTPVPKVNFINWQDSQKLEGYGVGDIISVMPPFNFRHTRMKDIQKLEEKAVPEGGIEEEIVFANPKFYVDDCLGNWEGDVDPLQIQIVDEDTETQFFGELKEKYWEDGGEKWSTEQFHTLPDRFTELALPAGQLYLLTSDWRSDQSWVHYYGCDPDDGYFTQNDLNGWNSSIPATNTAVTGLEDFFAASVEEPLRVKFWYDPEDPDGLYVGTWEITPTCQAAASSNSPVCEDETIELYGGPPDMDSYSWTGPNSFSSSEISPTIEGATLAMAGTYTLTVTRDTCTAVATTDVTVNEKPTATADSNSPVDEGETLELYGGPPDMASYSWTGPNSFSSNEISPTVSYSATTAMAGTYTLIVTNTQGCSDSDTTYVTVVVTDENQGYLDPQHSSTSYCMTTTVEIWVNVTDSFQGGEVVLEYDPDCADVTNWVRNGGDFAHGEWNSDNPGQEWIVFAADGLLTGDYLIGTLTIHCVSDSPDGCDTPLHFAEPSILTDDWGNPVPIAWVDGTFECGLGVCGDVAPADACDSEVNSQDFVLLLNYVGDSPGHATYYLCCDWCGDVAPADSCDGDITVQDYVLLLNYVGDSPGHATYYLCCQDGGGGAPRAVSAAADNEVNLDPQHSSAPFGETTDVKIWVHATNFQGGEIVLEYDPDCADVTSWVRNEDDFAHGEWNSDNPGQEWIVFAADGLLTGDYLIGTLTIRGAYEEGCVTVLDFADPSKLTDDWGNEIPATWIDGTFRSVKTYRVYLPLVMKNSQ